MAGLLGEEQATSRTAPAKETLTADSHFAVDLAAC